MKKIFICILLNALLVSLSYAAAEQVPANKTVTIIKAYNGFVIFWVTPSYTNNQGCSGGFTDRFRIDTSGTNGKEMYSALLSAAAANKNIGFGINGCLDVDVKVYSLSVMY